ncbi:MAG: folate family ECF transporter S component, partial [Clostridia bacterium]|nr:folate family ECF transporter S component [Clostridia bacterium]
MQEEVVEVQKETTQQEEKISIFSKSYWVSAAKVAQKTNVLVFAALICALRIVVKSLRIPVIPGGLNFSFDAYINALGSIVYGPLIGLMVGAVSDTIGAILFPSGTYFFPFIFVEMSSSFIFALFLWRRKLSFSRVIISKFTVSFVCNVILTSLCMKWMYAYFATGKTY